MLRLFLLGYKCFEVLPFGPRSQKTRGFLYASKDSFQLTAEISNLGGGQEKIQINSRNAVVNGVESTSLLDHINGGLGLAAGSNQVVTLDVHTDFVPTANRRCELRLE